MTTTWRGPTGRAMRHSLAAWALGAVVLRVIVVPPERCGPVERADVWAAAESATRWLVRNQQPDGTFLYRYDADSGEDLDGYNLVRHAGVTMSLYQAAAAGIDGALESADRGLEHALDLVETVGDRAALADDETSWKAGSTALLVVALVERRELTGETDHDEVLERLGRFLVGQVEPSGAVSARFDPVAGEPVVGSRSIFYTGEVGWALARLASELGPEWRDPSDAVGAYLANDRDDAEGRFPPVSDHWAAYRLEADAALSGLDDAERAQVDRLGRIFGVQVRYESQRTGSLLSWATRGRPTLAAGLGTLGEGLGRLVLAAEREPALADVAEPAAERMTCVTSLLVDRQAGADDVGEDASPDAVVGAWFQFGVTQMDDQQHALSALLVHLEATAA
ncbi:MAG: hypothetical protein S0880_22500 [Actinomycetota bacterium]|nr:hypothetical protein [Actinomycetota bacterium]